MTIAEIKQRTQETSPHYFTRSTMKFFHQTMKDFKVKKQADGRFLITAPMRDHSYKVIGESKRFFNPVNNELEHNLNSKLCKALGEL